METRCVSPRTLCRHGADLSGAVLPRELRGATLREARLVRARADRADLTGADLSEADLTGASLLGANLSNARLHDARLDRAVLLGATLDADAAGQVAGSSGATLPGSRLLPQLAAGCLRRHRRHCPLVEPHYGRGAPW